MPTYRFQGLTPGQTASVVKVGGGASADVVDTGTVDSGGVLTITDLDEGQYEASDRYARAAGTKVEDATVELSKVTVYGDRADGDVPVWNAATGRMEWGAGSSGASVPVLLTWDSDTSDYVPTEGKAATTPKVFIGPTDPATVADVTVNSYDQWVETTF